MSNQDIGKEKRCWFHVWSDWSASTVPGGYEWRFCHRCKCEMSNYGGWPFYYDNIHGPYPSLKSTKDKTK